MSEEKKAIVAKIEKLLRLSKSSNQHEAELALSRANELMQKHQIDAAEVETADIRSGADAVTEEVYTVKDQKMKLMWIETLANACASLFDGLILVNKQLHGTHFRFVGFKSDIPMMKALFEHLYGAWFGIVELDLAAAKARNDRIGTTVWQPKHTMKFKAGHGLGYAQALGARCLKLADERKAKVSAASNTCLGLVLVRGEALSKWEEAHGVKRIKRKASIGSSDGRLAGFNSGMTVPMGGALT